MAYRQTTNPLSRNSSSPLNAHDEAKVAELTKKIEARVKELNPTGDPQSRVDPYEDKQIQNWIAQRTAEKAKHKGEGPSRKSSSPVNFMGIKRPGRCTPFPNPDCEPGTPQYNLAKRLKPGGDLYKGKKK